MQQYGRFDIPVNLWQNTDKMEMHSWMSNKWSQRNLHMQKKKKCSRDAGNKLFLTLQPFWGQFLILVSQEA